MQQEFFGRGSSSNISSILLSLGTKRVLLVTGKSSYRSCGAQTRFQELLQHYPTAHFDGFSPNPTLEEALAGTKLCREFDANVIVAVGGGSAIDLAKCIAAFHAQPGQEKAIATGKQLAGAANFPVVAVPTTAGTGSESTHFAVIYVDGAKYSLAASDLLPRAAVLDPVYTDGLPPYITACTGFDALCQAVESFWAVGATGESHQFATQAITLLLANLRQATTMPSHEIRDNMLRAANYAGRAINISKTTAPHALSYAITSQFGIPHGHAVAMTLGAFFPVHEPQTEPRLSDRLSRSAYAESFEQLLELFGVTSSDEAKGLWYQLLKDCGLSLRLGSEEIADSPHIETIVAQVNQERLGNHPVILNTKQLVGLIRSIPST